MKKGILLPQHDVDPSETLAVAVLAEQAGLDSVWLIDHLHGRPKPRRPILELGAMLAGLAASTSTVHIGALVMRIGIRLPSVVAAMARADQMISSGRVTLALGLSDASNSAEQAAYGLPLEPRATRIEVMRRTIEALRKEAPTVPIWVGGGGKDVLDVVLSADGWNFWGSAGSMLSPLQSLRDSGFQGEISWAGSWSGESEIAALRSMDVDHVIVSTGKANYQDRIEQISSLP